MIKLNFSRNNIKYFSSGEILYNGPYLWREVQPSVAVSIGFVGKVTQALSNYQAIILFVMLFTA
jgi:hypothetical protein